jgi:hypothetical protein
VYRPADEAAPTHGLAEARWTMLFRQYEALLESTS